MVQERSGILRKQLSFVLIVFDAVCPQSEYVLQLQRLLPDKYSYVSPSWGVALPWCVVESFSINLYFSISAQIPYNKFEPNAPKRGYVLPALRSLLTEDYVEIEEKNVEGLEVYYGGDDSCVLWLEPGNHPLISHHYLSPPPYLFNLVHLQQLGCDALSCAGA